MSKGKSKSKSKDPSTSKSKSKGPRCLASHRIHGPCVFRDGHAGEHASADHGEGSFSWSDSAKPRRITKEYALKVRVTSAEHEAIIRHASNLGTGVSEIIRRALQTYLGVRSLTAGPTGSDEQPVIPITTEDL